MTYNNYWISIIISILAGTCIGLTTLLIQEKRQSTEFSYSAPVELASPSVVNVYTHAQKQPNLPTFDQPSKVINLGSGVIMMESGVILTNHHVIQNAQRIVIGLHDDRQVEAELIGSDPSTDLAVLKIHQPNLPIIKIGSSKNTLIGERVLAIGNPFGIGQTITAGIISAKGRNSIGLNTYENFLQTDAAINPGNSGGALVNLKGELIGISSAIYSSSGGSQGIGFVTPIDDAMQVMREILLHGEVVRGYLGMEAKKVTPLLAENLSLMTPRGLLVSEIGKGSPAEKAGIQIGDVIVKINDEFSDNPFQVKHLIASLKPGTNISLLGVRGAQSYKVNIVLEVQPTMQRLTY